MDGTEHRHELSTHIRRGKWVFPGFLAVALFFLWTEHRAHLLGVLPYLLFLACPLMHLFHHGRGHHRPGDAKQSDAPDGQIAERTGERDAH